MFPKTVEKWDVFEFAAPGRQEGNPFVDYDIQGVFQNPNETVTADGFYDGDGVYKVRFMPSFEGDYTFTVSGSFSDEVYTGTFTVTPAAAGNHGPVRVANTFHFAYEDGTPYYPVGTTCYVWTHQPQELQQKTLDELRKGYFNKIRFCVFPKHYDFNFRDPITFPYEGTPCDNSGLTKFNFNDYLPSNPENKWDFHRFNPEHFRLFENRIRDLRDMGIEADLIIMHPYDRWGFSEMDEECDDLYWKYVIARFAAYRNVWWSLANEWEFLKKKTVRDWERYADILCKKDPYHHLRSIHNAYSLYDYSRPWITHCCVQLQEFQPLEKIPQWRELYQKPIVVDELRYEGNIEHDWGNITGQEMVRRFWEITLRGAYAGHGETFTHPDNLLWWSHGVELHGESPERLKFLHKILCESPYTGLNPSQKEYRTAVSAPTFGPNDYRILYFGNARPAYKRFYFDDTNEYEVEIIDTWGMTIEKAGVFKGRFEVTLPGREFMALRIRKVG